MSKILCVGGSGFIGSYLMKEVDADNLDLKEGRDARNELPEGYDAIVFLACNQANTKESYTENWEMFQQLDKLRKNFDPYLIYISSAAVYTLNSWYALSKQLGEAYAGRFSNHTILRLSNVYGHGDGHGAPDRFMRGESTIHGSGYQIRDLIPVEKVVTKILQLLNTRTVGTFNVSSGVGTSVKEMFKLFGEGEARYSTSSSIGVERSILPPGRVEW